MTAPTKHLAVLIACLALVASGCGAARDTNASGQDSSSGSASSTPSSSPSTSVSADASGACQYMPTGQQAARKVKLPAATPTEKGPVSVSIGTNFGNLTATLDGKTAPCAVNAFLSLAKQGYYDKTTCHRIAVDSRGFHILQCGDPTATGAGGPGYQYAEEVTGNETYGAGTLAMAKTQAPSTTGAQFFVDFGPTQLPPQYTVLGKLTPAGLKVAKKAAAAALTGKPDPYDGAPSKKVELTKVR
ncbi:MAG: peptidylprolyl isomerase [Marmoricola sp.]